MPHGSAAGSSLQLVATILWTCCLLFLVLAYQSISAVSWFHVAQNVTELTRRLHVP